MSRTRSLLFLHFIVFIWGFTGILGKEISLGALQLVWWRVAIACAALALWALFSGTSLRASRSEVLRFLGVGLFTAGHWICFFASIKVSNVSTALAIISTTSFFVALVGPLIRRTKYHLYELGLGAVVIVGLLIIFHFEPNYKLGILLSLACSLLAAIFSSFNSVLVQKHGAVKIAFYEMLSCVASLSLVLAFTHQWGIELFLLSGHDLVCLLILGIVCTAFAFVAGIEVMKQLTPFTCALAINMEPVYTIVIALLVYGQSEYMSPQFYLGAAIILATLFVEAWLQRRDRSAVAGDTSRV